MTTHNFWKFASEVKDSTKLVDVFNKYAQAEKLSDFNMKYLWKAVNKDVENTFVKQAAETNSKIVSTAIKTVMEALPEVIQSVGAGSIEDVQPVADAVKDSVDNTPEVTPEVEKPASESKLMPKSDAASKPEAKPEADAGTGTVFDRLGE